jgi:hypothetical protein
MSLIDGEPGVPARRPALSSPLLSVLYLVVSAVCLILAFDFVFRLVGANNAGFAAWIYAVGDTLGAPFDSIFNQAPAIVNGTIVRWGDLVGIVVYSVVAGLIGRVTGLLAATGE